MFTAFSQYSRSRWSWFYLLLSTVGFEATALYFQYGVGLLPCTLCIYQRCAIFGIMIASLIALVSPQKLIFRLSAILLWLYSSYEGFNLAYLHARLQFAPLWSDTCTINVKFPTLLPLDKWLPSVFNATGFCADKIWSFLTIEMSQWMIIIFICYLAVAIIVLISQVFPAEKRSNWGY